MLIVLLNNQFLKEEGWKRNIDRAFCTSDLKVIFILLIKMIVIMIGVALVEVWETKPSEPFLRAWTFRHGLDLGQKILRPT